MKNLPQKLAIILIPPLLTPAFYHKRLCGVDCFIESYLMSLILWSLIISISLILVLNYSSPLYKGKVISLIGEHLAEKLKLESIKELLDSLSPILKIVSPVLAFGFLVVFGYSSYSGAIHSEFTRCFSYSCFPFEVTIKDDVKHQPIVGGGLETHDQGEIIVKLKDESDGVYSGILRVRRKIDYGVINFKTGDMEKKIKLNFDWVNKKPIVIDYYVDKYDSLNEILLSHRLE